MYGNQRFEKNFNEECTGMPTQLLGESFNYDAYFTVCALKDLNQN